MTAAKIDDRPTFRSKAIAGTAMITKKKSKASSVHPRNPAVTASAASFGGTVA